VLGQNGRDFLRELLARARRILEWIPIGAAPQHEEAGDEAEHQGQQHPPPPTLVSVARHQVTSKNTNSTALLHGL
jgi:hypothetical protein